MVSAFALNGCWFLLVYVVGLVVSWILFGWVFGLFLMRFIFLVLLPLVVCLGGGLVVGLLGLCGFGWLLFNCLILVGVVGFEVVVLWQLAPCRFWFYCVVILVVIW